MTTPADLRITGLTRLPDYCLLLEFEGGEGGEGGESGTVDLSDELAPPDLARFYTAALDPERGRVAWDTGTFLSAARLHELMRLQAEVDRRAEYLTFAMLWAMDTTDETIRTVERDYLDHWIEAATTPLGGRKVTSTAAARELCALACLCLERNRPMPEKLRVYMAAALRQCAEGRPADKALHLKRRKGRYPDPLFQVAHEKRLVGRIAWLIERFNYSPAEAKECVAASTGLDTRRIEQIWAEHRPTDEQWKRIRAKIELLGLGLDCHWSKADAKRAYTLLQIATGRTQIAE